MTRRGGGIGVGLAKGLEWMRSGDPEKVSVASSLFLAVARGVLVPPDIADTAQVRAELLAMLAETDDMTIGTELFTVVTTRVHGAPGPFGATPTGLLRVYSDNANPGLKGLALDGIARHADGPGAVVALRAIVVAPATPVYPSGSTRAVRFLARELRGVGGLETLRELAADTAQVADPQTRRMLTSLAARSFRIRE